MKDATVYLLTIANVKAFVLVFSSIFAQLPDIVLNVLHQPKGGKMNLELLIGKLCNLHINMKSPMFDVVGGPRASTFSWSQPSVPRIHTT